MVRLASVRDILEHFWSHFLRKRESITPVMWHSFTILAGLLLCSKPFAGCWACADEGAPFCPLWSCWLVGGCDGGPQVKWPRRFTLWSQADLGSNPSSSPHGLWDLGQVCLLSLSLLICTMGIAVLPSLGLLLKSQ